MLNFMSGSICNERIREKSVSEENEKKGKGKMNLN